MGLTFTFEYMKDSDFYAVEMRVGDAKLFGERHESLQSLGKSGEELVAALVADIQVGFHPSHQEPIHTAVLRVLTIDEAEQLVIPFTNNYL